MCLDASIIYPQYRKYANNRGYFKINSADEWEEIQLIGTKIIVNNYKANIFPDKNYINDLTFDYQNNWIKIEAKEYEAVKNAADK